MSTCILKKRTEGENEGGGGGSGMVTNRIEGNAGRCHKLVNWSVTTINA